MEVAKLRSDVKRNRASTPLNYGQALRDCRSLWRRNVYIGILTTNDVIDRKFDHLNS